MKKALNTQSSNRLTNYMEELTDQILPRVLSEYKSTKFTDNLILDIKGLALNRLWPMYRTSDRAKDFLAKDVQRDAIDKDVIRELRGAIEIVTQNPRC